MELDNVSIEKCLENNGSNDGSGQWHRLGLLDGGASPISPVSFVSIKIQYFVLGCFKCAEQFDVLDGLKVHLKNRHGINSTGRDQEPFKCSLCNNKIFVYYSSFKKHVKNKHPYIKLTAEGSNTIEESPAEIDGEERNSDNAITPINDRIKNPYFHECSTNKQIMVEEFSKIISKMRCDVKIPESKIQDFMNGANKMLESYQIFSIGLLKSFLNTKGISTDDDAVVDLINELYAATVFSEVKSIDDNLCYLSCLAKCAVPIVKTIVLADEISTKIFPLQLKRGVTLPARLSTSRFVTKEVHKKATFHYIPIINTLRLIMNNPAARHMVQQEQPTDDGTISSYKDGEQFKRHPFLMKYPDALRITLHVDDVEYLNPLSSRKTKKKVTNFSFKIQNMHPAINASLERVYVLLMVLSKVLKEYGYKKILEFFIIDMQKLSTDEGVKIKTSTGNYIIRAVLIDVVGDTLAIHEILGFMSPSANFFCRSCYATRKELRRGMLGDDFEQRTVTNVDKDLAELKDKTIKPQQCGLANETALHVLPYFHLANNWTFDPMHDLLEGVVCLVLKYILRDAVDKQWVTVSKINNLISTFEYGDAEKRDKPSPNFTKDILTAKGHAINQTAAQTWTLLRAFPFMFYNILAKNNNNSKIITALLKITYYSFSNNMTKQMINDLELAIIFFHEEISKSSVSKINKLHHICHYPKKIVEKGSSANDSCMLYEGKFKVSKGLARNSMNTKNLTFSLATKMNLRQVYEIIHHNYDLKKKEILRSSIRQKSDFEYSALLPNHEEVRVIECYESNKVIFGSGIVVKYKKCGISCYGVVLLIVDLGESYRFIIQELEMIAFCEITHSFKTKLSRALMAVNEEKIFKRKTYSLWQINGADDDFFYISLKYNDE